LREQNKINYPTHHMAVHTLALLFRNTKIDQQPLRSYHLVSFSMDIYSP